MIAAQVERTNLVSIALNSTDSEFLKCTLGGRKNSRKLTRLKTRDEELTGIMSSKDIYNVSPEQQEIMRWRDAKRRQLREMYLRDSQHPTKSLLCDTGIYRFSSANATVAKRFVPTATNTFAKWVIFGSLFVPLYFGLEKYKNDQEHRYRTGQVSYADRENKFV